MMSDSVKKSSMYAAFAIGLFIGFLGGVVYSSIQSNPNPAVPKVKSTAAAKSGLTPQQAKKIMALSQQVSKNPQDAAAWTELGNIFFDTAQLSQAISAYEKSLKLQPDNAGVLTDLGIMYRRSGQPDKAIKTFDRANAINPSSTQASFNKGIVLLYDKGDAHGAIKTWQTLLQKNPAAATTDGRPIADFIAEAKKMLVAGKK